MKPMRRLVFTIAMLCASLSFVWGQSGDLGSALRGHIDYLCAETLAGRKAGSEQGHKAADYVAAQFGTMGIEPWDEEGYLKPFSAPSTGRKYRNVVAKIEGRNPNDYVIIGAHYDHLGTKRGKIYTGADDNASGVAALLELARNFAIRNYKPLYTLVFVAFDAEEVGLYGSTAFSTLFAERPESVRLMVSMDMVGRLHDGALEFQGTGTLKDCAQRLNRAAEKNNVRISTKKFENTPLIATDTEPFAKLGIPTLAVSTGIHEDYHTPQDTPEKIDYEGLVRVVEMMADFVLSLDTEEGAVSTGKLSYKHRNARGVFDWGLTGAIGSSYHSYPKSAVEGKSARAWNVGLWAQASGRHLAVRTSLIYDKRKAQAPSDPTDIFSKAQTLSLQSATLPVEVLLKTAGKTMCAYVGAGAYGTYNFGVRVDGKRVAEGAHNIRAWEYGWQWSIGYRFTTFYIEATKRYALNGVYATDTPAANNRSSLCTIGIVF
ncbi:MAG: M20/M25/M40 family metallo-hydrolase [Tidjanibacter sp.]|nr:M20/M25/M40 family metallo-hydrolase [Tidjanibacter sp.]